MIVKGIGFEENKKCRLCENLAWYQLGNLFLCDRHLERFFEWRQTK